MKLSLGVSITHALAARASTLDSSQDAIDVAGATPLLVRQHVALDVLFATLDEVDVGLHALGLEASGQLGGDGGVGVQAGEGDELQHEALLGNVPDEGLEGLVGEAVGHPVEGGGEVVDEALAGVDAADGLAELLGDSDVGVAGLDPEEVGVGAKGEGSLGRGVHAGAVVVEALAGAGDVPVKVHGGLGVLVSKVAAAGDAHVAILGRRSEVLVNLGLADALVLEVRDGSLVKADELGALDPLGLESINLGTDGTLGLHVLDGLGEGLDGSVCDTEDELVVADVNGRGDELAGLGVGAGNDEVLAAHDVPLEARGVETVDVLADGDEDLAGQMAALLSTVELILKVHRRRTILRKELCELQHGRETAVAGITIGDDGAEVVDVGGLVALLDAELATRIPLLAVVHALRLGQALDLVGDRVVGVVAKVGGDLVGAGEEGGARPAGDVEDFLVGSLLGHLDGVDGAHCKGESHVSHCRVLRL